MMDYDLAKAALERATTKRVVATAVLKCALVAQNCARNGDMAGLDAANECLDEIQNMLLVQ